jgi:hypothetical protein
MFISSYLSFIYKKRLVMMYLGCEVGKVQEFLYNLSERRTTLIMIPPADGGGAGLGIA